jgi:hypothetical protein
VSFTPFPVRRPRPAAKASRPIAPRRPACHRLRRAALGLILCAPAAVLAAPAYQLGQGYPLPGLGLTAGGYASIRFSKLEGEKTKLDIPDLSLFLYGDLTPTWHVFTEVELSHALKLTDSGLSGSDADFDVERLYADHNLTPWASLRLGKFLTPIGRWNQIHADPLVWTVSRPLTSSAAFARHATGLQLYGTHPLGQSSLDYQLYADDSSNLDPNEGREDTFEQLDIKPNPPSSFKRGAGLRLLYRSADDALRVGFSTARYGLVDQPGTKQLVGADLVYTWSNWELSGESVYRREESGAGPKEWGSFVQLVAPVTDGLYAVFTHERYRPAGFPQALSTNSIGLTYRPSPPVAIKLEHRDARGEEELAPVGWLASISVLL